MTENLTRKYQKIFAQNAGAQGKTVFGSTAQGNTQYTTDIDTMQSEAYENGFSDAVVSKKAPVLQDFNTVENITTRQLAYLFQKGIPEWNNETTYFKGNVVLNIENNIPFLYYSLIDNNLSNQLSNVETWKKIPLDINIDNKANTNLNNINTILISIATDLNTITTPGNYEFQLAIHTNTPFLAGAQTAFGMFVNVNPINNTVSQYVWSYGNEFYYRTYLGATTTWSAWAQVANTNLNNLSAVGKETISNLGMPFGTLEVGKYIDYTLTENFQQIEAPADGWFYFNGVSIGNELCNIGMNVVGDVYSVHNQTNYQNQALRLILPVKKGTKVAFEFTNIVVAACRFLYTF